MVEKPEDVDAAIARLRAAGYPIDVETVETCCYAVQNKVWATDPDGRRETYYVSAEDEERDSPETTCCGGPAPAGTGACCVKDAEAKANGDSGCGCGSNAIVAEVAIVT